MKCSIVLILLHVQCHMLCRHCIDHDLYYSVFAKLDNTYMLLECTLGLDIFEMFKL